MVDASRQINVPNVYIYSTVHFYIVFVLLGLLCTLCIQFYSTCNILRFKLIASPPVPTQRLKRVLYESKVQNSLQNLLVLVEPLQPKMSVLETAQLLSPIITFSLFFEPAMCILIRQYADPAIARFSKFEAATSPLEADSRWIKCPLELVSL